MWFGSHAFTEPRKGAGLFLVATLPEPALYGPYIPVELLGQALQPLLIWVLAIQNRHPTCQMLSSSWPKWCKNSRVNTYATLVIAVNTFSRIALDWAFCGPLAWIFRPMAHGLAMNLKWKYHSGSDQQFFADHSYQDLSIKCVFYPTRKCNIGGPLLHYQVLESISEFKLNAEVYKHLELNSI